MKVERKWRDNIMLESSFNQLQLNNTLDTFRTTTKVMYWQKIVVGLLLGSFKVSHGQSHQSRELVSNCPINEFEFADTREEHIEGTYDAYSKGAAGVELVGKLRSKPNSFYQNIVDQIIMFACDVDVASERCVEEDSIYAAKDWEGNCINGADYTCPIGMCERSSNCYWNTLIEGENRTTRFPIKDYSKAEAALVGETGDISLQYHSYAGGLAIFAFVGAAASFVTLILWMVFFIGRYFCCCLWTQGFCFLCSPIPSKDGYKTCRDIVLPVIFYVISCVAIAVAASMAFVGNEDISVAASNTFLHADGLITDLMQFLGRSRLPLENVQDIVMEAALDAQGIFNGTDFVKKDALKIVDSFLGFYTIHSQGLNASNTLEGFDSAASGFDSQVTPITDSVQSVLDTLELDLYDKADFIRDGLQQALIQLDSFSEQSLGWQSQVYTYEGQELGIRDTRQLAVMVLFLVAVGVALFGLVGILLSKTKLCSVCNHMIKITGFFSAILGTIAILVASIGVSANFLIHDACQISDIIVQNFEPYVGDVVAPAANAAFNDTNLAVALNLTEKVDFQRKLDEGLSVIEGINITASFNMVIDPLRSIQSMMGSVSDTSLSLLNEVTTSDEFPCAFGDIDYTKETILQPWTLGRPTDNTSYIIRDNFGNSTTYSRLGTETAEDYVGRIYNIAGICSTSSDCCIYIDQSQATCQSAEYATCDYGASCVYPCNDVRTAIVQGYNAFVELYDVELAIKADLGIECPSNGYDGTCPSQQFKMEYSNLTLVESIEDYRGKISTTKDNLVDLASTSVGDTMLEVEDFLCNMNISFIERRYEDMRDDICLSGLGGISQITVAFWIVAIGLEIIAITSGILAIRLQPSYDKIEDFDVMDEVKLY